MPWGACTDFEHPERNKPSLHGRKFNTNPKFLGTAEAYFVCHIGSIFQISLIYAFIGCPQSVLQTMQLNNHLIQPSNLNSDPTSCQVQEFVSTIMKKELRIYQQWCLDLLTAEKLMIPRGSMPSSISHVAKYNINSSALQTYPLHKIQFILHQLSKST